MSISISDVISSLAFVLSSYATMQTIRFNAKQKTLIASQEKLNAILLEKEEREAVSGTRADISAKIIDIGTKNKKLRISNIGKSTARNIRISFPRGNEFVVENDISAKFPLESLDVFTTVDVLVAIHLQTNSKQTILVQWDDNFQNNHEKEICLTI